jgi:hypothetical protein
LVKGKRLSTQLSNLVPADASAGVVFISAMFVSP